MTSDGLLAIDAGTTNIKALLIDTNGDIISKAAYALGVHYPRPGWVEQSPDEIWAGTREAIASCLKGVKECRLLGLGISNQRETIVCWSRRDGKPLHAAIVWQCRRSAEVCDEWKTAGLQDRVQRKTGLQVDPLFPASKIVWLLRYHPEIRSLTSRGEICFGTVDSWLIWNLTSGKTFATDVSNASRTQLFNLEKADWDEDQLALCGISRRHLPEVRPSCSAFGDAELGLGYPIKIRGVLGDSHAALLGHGVTDPGIVKATYGTGSSLMTLANKARADERRISRTVAWQLDQIRYAYEGNITVTGSGVAWAAEFIGEKDLDAVVARANSLPSNVGIYFVPAMAGLGAPFWNDRARGAVVGLSFATQREHLVRAALEAIAFQITDVFQAMEEASGTTLTSLFVDGGATRNDWLMQFQADVLQRPVLRSRVPELSGFGAAVAAAHGLGFWQSSPRTTATQNDTFQPKMSASVAADLLHHWRATVAWVNANRAG
jgi:glycerol kinase